MTRDTRTVAQRNRGIRQEALREQLSEQCRLQHILDNINKLEDADHEMDQLDVQRVKTANDQRIKLLGKYLPDLKATEITGADGEPVQLQSIEWTVVKPKD